MFGKRLLSDPLHPVDGGVQEMAYFMSRLMALKLVDIWAAVRGLARENIRTASFPSTDLPALGKKLVCLPHIFPHLLLTEIRPQ